MTSLPEPYSSQLEPLAIQLASAVADASEARAAVEAAEEYQERIAARIAALTDERTALIARRGGGRYEQGDSAALNLIVADLEGLQPLLAEAAARVAAANGVHAEHSIKASNLRAEIAGVEALAARDALVKHADDLAAKLHATINALAEACHHTGDQPFRAWGAPPALFRELRKIAAARGDL